MSAKLPRLLVGLAVALAVVGTLMFLASPEPELRAAEGSLPLVVQTQRLSPLAERPQAEIAGLLEAVRMVEIYAEIPGLVVEVGAEELDRVEAEQLLARIDPVSVEASVARAAAALARAESELALSRATLARQRELRGSSVASEQVFEEAENAERVAVAAVREAEASLREAEDRLAKHAIHAPFSGSLRYFDVEAGEYVQVGQKLAELLDTSVVRMTVELADRDVVSVRVGEPAHVTVEARPGEEFAGRVARVAGAADPVNSKFPVQIEVPNAEARLLPGMVGRARFEVGEARSRVALPREAVMEEYGLRYAFVVEPNAEGGWLAHRRRVETREIPFTPSQLEVLSGLELGEEVAVTSVRQLWDGAAVRRDETLVSTESGEASATP